MNLMKILPYSFVIIFGLSLCGCTKESEAKEIPCQKNIVEGEWDVTNEYKEYFEIKDSTATGVIDFIYKFASDGTGTFKSNSSSMDNHFTWVLQCSPNHLLLNSLGGPPLDEDPDEDPMNYTAFSSTLFISKITEDEIQMELEYYLGVNETKRLVTYELTYSRIK